jgi:hypothetical protein
MIEIALPCGCRAALGRLLGAASYTRHSLLLLGCAKKKRQLK